MIDLVAVHDFAIRRHSMTRYGSDSYEVHLESVETVLIETGYDAPMFRAAAWLHDTIEDTGTTRGEIEALAGIDVADLVWAVTGVGANRKTRNASIYGKLRLHPTAWPLKMADRVANLEHTSRAAASIEIAAMYLSEEREFLSAIHGYYLTTSLYLRLVQAYQQTGRAAVSGRGAGSSN